MDVTQYNAIPAPPVSGTDSARVYYNGTSDTLKLSLNGGAYSNLLTVLTGDLAYVKTDQASPQTIGSTGARLTKLWVTDITCTNSISANITGNAATVTTNANLTGAVTSSGNATTIAPITVASSAGTYTGLTITLTSTETQGIGDAVQIDANGKAHLAKADAIANAHCVLLAATAVTGSASNTYLLPGGTLKLSSSPSWTVGGIVYLSITGTTGNTLTQTAPSGTDNVIQPLGVAVAADTLLFMPNLTEVEHT